VGVSNESQEDAYRYYRKWLEQYYIWIKKDWHYVTESDYWNLMSWKYISIKKKGEIPKYTMKQLKDKIWNFELVK